MSNLEQEVNLLVVLLSVANMTTVFCTERLNVKVYTVKKNTSFQDWAGLTPEVCCTFVIYATVK